MLVDPATFAAELDELTDLVVEHGVADRYEPLLRHWRFHCAAWADYLSRRAELASYADYLARREDNSAQRT